MPLYQFHGMTKSHLELDNLEMPVQRVKRKLLQQADSVSGIGVVTEEVECLSKRQRWDPEEKNSIFEHRQMDYFVSSQVPASFIEPHQVLLDDPHVVERQKGVPAYGQLQLSGNLLHGSFIPQTQITRAQEQHKPQPTEALDCMLSNAMEENDVQMEISDPFCQTQLEERVEHCCDSCSGGTRSPVSNRIRCSCRPYDLADETPYCSDYY